MGPEFAGQSQSRFENSNTEKLCMFNNNTTKVCVHVLCPSISISKNKKWPQGQQFFSTAVQNQVITLRQPSVAKPNYWPRIQYNVNIKNKDIDKISYHIEQLSMSSF
jgi:hypothetical protein